MNLNWVFSRKYRWPEHFPYAVCCLGKSPKVLTTSQFLVSTIFFTNRNISFFNLCFDFFSINTKKVNQIRNNVVCVVAHVVFVCTPYESLQRFSTYFRKLKEIRVSHPIFPDFVISYDYVYDQPYNDSFHKKIGVSTI